MTKRVQVLGAGGHALVAVATLQDLGFHVTSLFDDDPERTGRVHLGVRVSGPISQAATDVPTIIAIGDNRTRASLATRHRLVWADAVVHPRSYVHASVLLGPGTVIFAGAVIQPGARLGAHVIINTSASVDHDCRIRDYVHIAPGVHLCGAVEIEEGALLGVAACVRPEGRVGAWATVGAGGAVIGAIPSGARATGVPARVTEDP